MQRKAIKYTVFIIVILLLGYNSIYFKKLDEVKAAASPQNFSAPSYAREIYSKLDPKLDSAVSMDILISLLRTDPAMAFDRYSNALSIGNVRYFLVQGNATVKSISDDMIDVSLLDSSKRSSITIATEFIYGNAIRDASGLVKLTDFNNTDDFNNVSAEINKLIREDVIPPFRQAVKSGDTIMFRGAIEMNRAHIDIDSIEIIPIQLSIRQ
jgi:hypothetical protein